MLTLAQQRLAAGDPVEAEALLALLKPRADSDDDDDDDIQLMPGQPVKPPIDPAAAVAAACYGLPATFDTRLARCGPQPQTTARVLSRLGCPDTARVVLAVIPIEMP